MTKKMIPASQQRRRFGPGRSALRRAAGDRGKTLHNIWYVYSSRIKRDVVLPSDPAYDHFCLLEGDPTVTRYELEYPSATVIVDGEALRTRFDAMVEFRSAPPELREIKSIEDPTDLRAARQQTAQVRAAELAGFRYVRFTSEDLQKRAQLIVNWRCGTSYLTACRDMYLEAHCREIVGIVSETRRCSIGTILTRTNPDARALYLAALFRCLQDVRLHSDLELKPLCAATVLALEVPCA